MNEQRMQLALTESVARALLEAGCVHFRHDEPFRLPSGWASPVYIDCRRLIAFPKLRRELVSRGVALLASKGRLDGIDAVVGAESSGIAFGAWIAEELDLPLLYVRKEPKGLGPASQVEGVVSRGDRVLLVDDMMAAARSKRNFCEALSTAGAVVSDIFVVFDYDTFPTATKLAPWKLEIHALANWKDILACARTMNSVAAESLNELESFLSDPTGWSQRHGGIGREIAFMAPR